MRCEKLPKIDVKQRRAAKLIDVAETHGIVVYQNSRMQPRSFLYYFSNRKLSEYANVESKYATQLDAGHRN